ncbi:MAG: helix-turn-helix transcriptional regulator [Vagococcus sp.]
MKNNLMTIRKKNKLNQDQLASEMEVSRQTISSLENGRYNPSILLAMKLARFFHVTVEDIFIYEEDTQHDNIN